MILQRICADREMMGFADDALNRGMILTISSPWGVLQTFLACLTISFCFAALAIILPIVSLCCFAHGRVWNWVKRDLNGWKGRGIGIR